MQRNSRSVNNRNGNVNSNNNSLVNRLRTVRSNNNNLNKSNVKNKSTAIELISTPAPYSKITRPEHNNNTISSIQKLNRVRRSTLVRSEHADFLPILLQQPIHKII